MILTVCPNPCIDCTIEIEELKVGKLNRLDNKLENTSGKALNTAVGIKRLGGEVIAGGFMFETGGRRFERFLKAEGIPYDFVNMKGSVRVNYKIIDGKSMMTEINDKGDFVPPAKQQELLNKVAENSRDADIVVISGSLPQGVEEGFYAKIIAAAGDKKVIVDCEGAELAASLNAGVYMVKPNLYEVEKFFDRNIESLDAVKECAEELTRRGAKTALVSLGKLGAILTDGVTTYYSKSMNVAVNSTVGAGDSMIAAACLAIEDGCDMAEILKRAVAAGTASVTTAGTNLFTKEKYYEILDYLTVEKL